MYAVRTFGMYAARAKRIIGLIYYLVHGDTGERVGYYKIRAALELPNVLVTRTGLAYTHTQNRTSRARGLVDGVIVEATRCIQQDVIEQTDLQDSYWRISIDRFLLEDKNR